MAGSGADIALRCMILAGEGTTPDSTVINTVQLPGTVTFSVEVSGVVQVAGGPLHPVCSGLSAAPYLLTASEMWAAPVAVGSGAGAARS
jgi:hypothetical protein